MESLEESSRPTPWPFVNILFFFLRCGDSVINWDVVVLANSSAFLFLYGLLFCFGAKRCIGTFSYFSTVEKFIVFLKSLSVELITDVKGEGWSPESLACFYSFYLPNLLLRSFFKLSWNSPYPSTINESLCIDASKNLWLVLGSNFFIWCSFKNFYYSYLKAIDLLRVSLAKGTLDRSLESFWTKWVWLAFYLSSWMAWEMF
jgi:hypothetical protein